MQWQAVAIFTAGVTLGGCASAPSSALIGQRTVFSNPYVSPEINRRGIGPACDIAIGRDATCVGGPLVCSGRGRHVLFGHGRTGRLTRAQRDILRDRVEAINERAAALEQAEQTPPPPPPIATQPDL